jgi:hypothetical protein
MLTASDSPVPRGPRDQVGGGPVFSKIFATFGFVPDHCGVTKGGTGGHRGSAGLRKREEIFFDSQDPAPHRG